MASAEKTDARRLQQAERQMTASTKNARCPRRLARQAEVSQEQTMLPAPFNWTFFYLSFR